MAERSEDKVLLQDIENAFDALMLGDEAKLKDRLKEIPIGPAVGVTVYRQTSLSALVSAVSETYSTCRHILGDDYFHQCATTYCQLYPMVHHDLNLYGADFTGFLTELTTSRPELASLQFLTDLSRLEWALNEAFFASQKLPFDMENFAALTDDERDRLLLELSPDVRLMHARSNVKEIYEFHLIEENINNELPFEVTAGDFYYLIHRGTKEAHYQLNVDELDVFEFEFLTAIKDEMSFHDLCESFTREVEGELQPPPFGAFISRGIINGFQI